jgi:hypothetical protein
MTVSTGGTVSWTPTTDSVYMDHAEYLVVNDAGRKDTLTFNIFVNSDYHAPASIKPSRITKSPSKPFEIISTTFSNKIKFSLPSSVTSICIYDINGRIVDRIAPIVSTSGASAVWPCNGAGNGKIPTGKYFAKVSDGRKSAVKSVLYVR